MRFIISGMLAITCHVASAHTAPKEAASRTSRRLRSSYDSRSTANLTGSTTTFWCTTIIAAHSKQHPARGGHGWSKIGKPLATKGVVHPLLLATTYTTNDIEQDHHDQFLFQKWRVVCSSISSTWKPRSHVRNTRSGLSLTGSSKPSSS